AAFKLEGDALSWWKAHLGQGQQEIRGPHPGVCYKATRGCFSCRSTQHKVKDCPQGK
nr:zinc finger, CCHC-type, retrotransposon Gag domain protein [Tanacetum cinerariifolium]